MEYTPEILQRIKTFGALGYSAERITVLLNLTASEKKIFFAEYDNKNSPIYQAYEQGVAIGEFNQDAALMKQAEKGDLFSMQELKIRQFKRDLERDRKERFGL